jgi:hypothetical protein
MLQARRENAGRAALDCAAAVQRKGWTGRSVLKVPYVKVQRTLAFGRGTAAVSR